MVLKSKVRKAVRLAPVFASLTALAMVAACARTNGAKTAIAPEKREKAALVTEKKLFADYNENDPGNMEFAAHFKGASVKIEARTADKIQATIKMVFDDRKEPVIVSSVIPYGESAKANPIVDMANIDKNAKNDLTVQAGCGGPDCAVLSARINLAKEIVAAPVPTQGNLGQADISAALQPSEPTSVPSTQASDVTPSTPETAPAGSATPEAEKKMTHVSNVITFTIENSAAKEETEDQKAVRLSKLSLMKSGHSASGEGVLTSYEEAYRSLRGTDAPEVKVEVLLAVPTKAAEGTKETPNQPAPPDQRAENPTPESAGDAPAADATAGAGAGAGTSDGTAADKVAADKAAADKAAADKVAADKAAADKAAADKAAADKKAADKAAADKKAADKKAADKAAADKKAADKAAADRARTQRH